MTTYTPVYRLTLYAPSSTGPETTVLTPTVGSVHSDPFQVISTTGVSGWQPLLDIPVGGGSTTTLPDLNVSIGEYSVRLYDFRPSTTSLNVERWVTAFIGDDNRTNRLVGRKAVLEESLDGGTSWHPFFNGRVTALDLTSPLVFTMRIRDSGQSLKREIFQHRPDRNAVSYASFTTLLPIGFSHQVSSQTAATRMSGSITNIATSVDFLGFGSTFYQITFAVADQRRPDNIYTPHLERAQREGTFVTDVFGGFNAGNRIFETNLSAVVYNKAHPPSVIPSLMVTSVLSKKIDGTERVTGLTVQKYHTPFWFWSPAVFDPALDGWTLGDTVELYCYNKGPVSEENPLWLGDVHPVQVWKDILDGRFDPSSSVDHVPYDVATINTLISDTSYPQARYKITGPMDKDEFITEHICKPYNLAYTWKMSGSDAVLLPFTTALPASLPSMTITSDDVLSTSGITWNAGFPLTSIIYTSYEDQITPLVLDNNTQGVSSTSTTADGNEPFVRSFAIPIQSTFNSTDLGISGRTLKIDAIGNRYFVASVDTLNENESRIQNVGRANIMSLANRFLFGTPSVDLSVRKSSSFISASVGDWVVVDLDQLPNANIRQRGGTRLMQIVEKSPSVSSIHLTLLDGALTSSMLTPTLNSVSQHPSASNAALVSITTVEPAQVLLQSAIVSTGAAQPAESDGLWTTINQQPIDTTTSQIGAVVPLGKRTYFRARSLSYGSGLKLPSSWTAPVGAYLEPSPLSAPTGLGVSGITPLSFTGSWTTGSSTALIDTYLGSPSGSTASFYQTLPAGSDRLVITGLDTYVSSSFTFAVRHRLGQDVSPTASINFSVSGTAPTLPDLSYILVYVG